jgi:hypothetical protein
MAEERLRGLALLLLAVAHEILRRSCWYTCWPETLPLTGRTNCHSKPCSASASQAAGSATVGFFLQPLLGPMRSAHGTGSTFAYGPGRDVIVVNRLREDPCCGQGVQLVLHPEPQVSTSLGRNGAELGQNLLHDRKKGGLWAALQEPLHVTKPPGLIEMHE